MPNDSPSPSDRPPKFLPAQINWPTQAESMQSMHRLHYNPASQSLLGKELAADAIKHAIAFQPAQSTILARHSLPGVRPIALSPAYIPHKETQIPFLPAIEIHAMHSR